MSGDPILGYVSLGRGITIHREDCPNVAALRKDPERFVPVAWDGDNETSFKVELQVDAWDRHRLLEDLSRTFAEAGINIVEARCIVSHPMVKNRFVVEVGRHPGAQERHQPAALDRRRLRRLPRHADRRLARPAQYCAASMISCGGSCPAFWRATMSRSSAAKRSGLRSVRRRTSSP